MFIFETNFAVRPTSDTHPRLNPTTATTLKFVNQIRGGVALCVDNSNIHQSGLRGGWKVDLGLCKQHLCGEKLVSATIAVTQAPFHRPSQDAFYRWLESTGWVVNSFMPLVSESGIVFENESAVDGDVAAQIRAAIRSEASSIVVLSGDRAMAAAILEARRAGLDVYVVAGFGCMSTELKKLATDFAYIEDLLPLIGRVYH